MNIEKAIQTQAIANLKSKAVINILHTAYHVRCKVSDTLKAYGLTPEQYNVLRILKGKHPDQMCVRDIAGRMIERSSNVPRIIDRLELKKLVKRGTSTIDKRETVITLTQAGINMLETVNAIVENANIEMCGLDDEELTALNALLDKYRKE